jgi:hypothetical protein
VARQSRGASSRHSVVEPRLSAFTGLPTAGCSTGGIRPRWPERKKEVRELLVVEAMKSENYSL